MAQPCRDQASRTTQQYTLPSQVGCSVHSNVAGTRFHEPFPAFMPGVVRLVTERAAACRARAAFVGAAIALAARYPATGPMIDTVDLADEVTAVQRVIGPQAIALAVFAALAGLVALAVMAQLLSRQLSLDAVEFPVLRALGMTQGRLAALSLAEVGLVTAAGAWSRRRPPSRRRR